MPPSPQVCTPDAAAPVAKLCHSPTPSQVLLRLVRDPAKYLLYRWNWKSALLSSALRAALFFAVNLSAGLHALYHAADIFIHPNPREPFGIAPLEAMAAGLPVVAPGSGGILTYANPTNAWLAEPSAAGFAEAIASVQSNPGNRLQKVERALCTARNYSWPLVTPNFFQLYDQFCEPTRKLDAKVAAARTKSAAA